MESSKEKIEAQLCDYVEGELDDAQRAEIEQHLAANPHHQALIAELRAASGLLRDLPRATVPVELNESLCGQLERSALLDPNDEVYDPARSVNRWPQFTAVAAVLILAAGLAFVVMYVLPPSGGNAHNQIAMDEKGAKSHGTVADGAVRDATSQASTYGREKQADLRESLDRKNSPENAASTPESARRVSRMAAPAMAPTGGAASDVRLHNSTDDLNVARLPANQRGLVTAAEVENVRKWMSASLGADNTVFKPGAGNSLYLVVSTTNAAAANGQLAAYFKSNGIQYMEDETRLPALGTNALAEGRDQNRDTPSRQFGIEGGVTVAEASREGGTEKDKAAAVVGGGGDLSKNTPALKRDLGDRDAARPLERGEEKKTEDAFGARRASEVPAAPAQGVRAKEPTDATPPAPASVGKPVTADVDARPDATSVTGREAGRHEAQGVHLNGALESVQPSVIVARMNRRQVNELSAALSKQQGQHAELKEFAPTVDDAVKQQATTGAAAATPGAEGGEVAQTAPDSAALTLKQEVRGGATPAPAAAPADHVLAEKTEESVVKGPAESKVPSLSLGTTAGMPATAPVNPTASGAGGVAAGGEAFRLSADPLDEPVDVVIVVKKEAAPTTAPKPQIDGAP
jgi:hypothetical protein